MNCTTGSGDGANYVDFLEKLAKFANVLRYINVSGNSSAPNKWGKL